MRWHATRRNAVVVGFRKHVAATTVDATAVAQASSIAALFDGEEVQVPRWIDDNWARMRDGLAETERLWRVASGGNISISSSLYRRAGGYDPDYWAEWGGEDNEIAYRLYVLGGLFIPERDAMAWHLGVGTSLGPEAEQRGERSRLRLASRLPSPTLQRPKHLVPEVPEVCIELDVTGETAEEVVHCGRQHPRRAGQPGERRGSPPDLAPRPVTDAAHPRSRRTRAHPDRGRAGAHPLAARERQRIERSRRLVRRSNSPNSCPVSTASARSTSSASRAMLRHSGGPGCRTPAPTCLATRHSACIPDV